MTAQEVIAAIRAEIERRLKNTRDYMNGAGMKYKGPKYHASRGRESAYDAILSLISTLESEKPINPDDAMKALDEKIALVKQSGTWDGVDVDKYMDEVRGREPEKPMDGLEDELKDYLRRYYNCDYPMQIEENTCSPTMPHIVEAARHFAKWGAEHLKK